MPSYVAPGRPDRGGASGPAANGVWFAKHEKGRPAGRRHPRLVGTPNPTFLTRVYAAKERKIALDVLEYTERKLKGTREGQLRQALERWKSRLEK